MSCSHTAQARLIKARLIKARLVKARLSDFYTHTPPARPPGPPVPGAGSIVNSTRAEEMSDDEEIHRSE